MQLKLLSRAETAKRLRISCRTLDEQIAAGKIPATKIGARVLIPEEAIADLVIKGAMNDALIELVERTTRESSVPTLIEDDATIEQVAAVMRGGDRDARAAG